MIPQKNNFKYFGSIILQKDRKVDDDVTYRVKMVWLRWRATTWVFLLKLKHFFLESSYQIDYNVCIWVLSNKEDIRVKVGSGGKEDVMMDL